LRRSLWLRKKKILPNKPILKIHNLLSANEIRKNLRPFGTQNKPKSGPESNRRAASKPTGEDGSNQKSGSATSSLSVRTRRLHLTPRASRLLPIIAAYCQPSHEEIFNLLPIQKPSNH